MNKGDGRCDQKGISHNRERGLVRRINLTRDVHHQQCTKAPPDDSSRMPHKPEGAPGKGVTAKLVGEVSAGGGFCATWPLKDQRLPRRPRDSR